MKQVWRVDLINTVGVFQISIKHMETVIIMVSERTLITTKTIEITVSVGFSHSPSLSPPLLWGIIQISGKFSLHIATSYN